MYTGLPHLPGTLRMPVSESSSVAWSVVVVIVKSVQAWSRPKFASKMKTNSRATASKMAMLKCDPFTIIEASAPGTNKPKLTRQFDEHEGFLKPLVTTEFVDWSAKTFIMPPQSSKDLPSPNSLFNSYSDRCSTSRLLAESEERRSVGTNKLDDQVFFHRNPGPPATLMFHPLHPLLTVADKNNVTIWDVDRNQQISHWRNNNPSGSCISSMAVMNPATPHTYVCTACDDGSVRVWRDCFTPQHQVGAQPPSLVTSFQATHDINPATRGTGLLMSWEQDSTTLAMGGDSRTVRLWDMQAERRTQEITTGGDSNSYITALHSHQAGPWVACGFSDGYVRLLDRRLPSNKAVVKQWREHTSWVISAHLLNASQNTTKIITGSISGEVRLWDIRQSNNVQVLNPNQEMTAMATHANAHLFAIGSVNQVIGVYHASGSSVNMIKYHEGFMGQRIAPVSCLAFHPRRVLLAAGTTDSYITVYGLARR
ncbi:unnamed protein product, partial [Meganyctiphanes norvegica]